MQDSDLSRFWKGRRILVTGATGFVGSWLLRELAERGATVTGLGRPRRDGVFALADPGHGRIVETDITDLQGIQELLHEIRTDTVFHLAAINTNIGTSTSPAAIFETNIRGTWSLLEACRLSPAIEQVVVASSREAQEDLQPRLGRRPKRHPYHVSKKTTELIAQSYNDTYGMPVAISRSDNVYGGGDLNWNRLIPGALRQLLLHGRAPTLRSNGTLRRDFVHVQDMVHGYLMLAARTAEAGVRGEVFDFSTGVQTSALSLVTQLCEMVGRSDLKPVSAGDSQPERSDPTPGSTAPHPLGWVSRVKLSEGLRATADWYANYFRLHPEADQNPI